jgi:hypothetical protein
MPILVTAEIVCCRIDADPDPWRPSRPPGVPTIQPVGLTITPVAEALKRLHQHLQSGAPLVGLDGLCALPELPDLVEAEELNEGD